MIRRPPRSTLSSSSAASDVYKRQIPEIHEYIQMTLLTYLLPVYRPPFICPVSDTINNVGTCFVGSTIIENVGVAFEILMISLFLPKLLAMISVFWGHRGKNYCRGPVTPRHIIFSLKCQ